VVLPAGVRVRYLVFVPSLRSFRTSPLAARVLILEWRYDSPEIGSRARIRSA